jgi:glycosyltransferase involved in cell wall biosynthesis
MTESHKRLLVIMPAFNEAGRVGPAVRAVGKAVPEAAILVIDDGSGDSTAQEAAEAGAQVLSHAINLGYGAALESGYLYGLAGGYDAVVQMDADGQHIPEFVRQLSDPVLGGHADLVVGSRFLSSSSRSDLSLAKRFARRILQFMLLIAGHRVFSDPTSGFQCLGMRALKLYCSADFPEDYPDADVLLMTHYEGLTIRHVPVRMAPRNGGRSIHSGLKPLYYGLKMALSILLVSLRYRGSNPHVPIAYDYGPDCGPGAPLDNVAFCEERTA